MNREHLIGRLDKLYEALHMIGLGEHADEILDNNNASDNDNDPDEGYMVTMSNIDLRNAIKDMELLYSSWKQLHISEPKTKHESYKSRRRFVEAMEEKELLEDRAGQLLCNLFEDMGVDHELAYQFSRFEDVVEWIADVVMQLKD